MRWACLWALAGCAGGEFVWSPPEVQAEGCIAGEEPDLVLRHLDGQPVLEDERMDVIYGIQGGMHLDFRTTVAGLNTNEPALADWVVTYPDGTRSTQESHHFFECGQNGLIRDRTSRLYIESDMIGVVLEATLFLRDNEDVEVQDTVHVRPID